MQKFFIDGHEDGHVKEEYVKGTTDNKYCVLWFWTVLRFIS